MKEPFWKARYSVLLFIWLAWVLSYIDRQVMNFSIGLIGEEFSLDPTYQGWVMSAFFAGYALFQIPGGFFADKWGPRLSMAVAIIWWSVFTMLTGVASSFFALIIIRFLFGIGEGAFPAGSWKSISTHFPSSERGRATAIQGSVGSLGSAISAIVGAGLIYRYGWHNVFFYLGIPGFFIALGIYYFCRNKPAESPFITAAELKTLEADVSASQSTARGMSALDILKSPIVWQLMIIWCLFNAAFWGFSSWLPQYMLKEHNLNMKDAGLWTSIPFFVGALGTFIGGYFSDKFKNNRTKTYAISSVVGGLLLAAALQVTDLKTIIFFQSLSSFFMFFCVGLFWGVVMDVIDSNSMGMASGVINIGSQLAAMGTLPIMGRLIVLADGKFSYAFMAVIATLILSGFVMMTVRLNKASS